MECNNRSQIILSFLYHSSVAVDDFLMCIFIKEWHAVLLMFAVMCNVVEWFFKMIIIFFISVRVQSPAG